MGLNRWLAVIASVSLSAAAPSSADKILETLPYPLRCSPAIQKKLLEWRASGEIFQDAPGEFQTRTWRLATERLGEWAFVSVSAGDDPTLVKVDASAVQRVTFSGSCEPSIEVRKIEAADTKPNEFGNSDLERVIKEHATGIVYVWSPHMPLSVDGYGQVAEAARQLGVAMTAVLDPRADASYAESVAKENGIPQDALRTLSSSELLFRNAGMHAPSILV